MKFEFSNRSRPSATRITAGLRLSYRIIFVGTPPKRSNACTCPSSNDSCAWFAYAICTALPEYDRRTREHP